MFGDAAATPRGQEPAGAISPECRVERVWQLAGHNKAEELGDGHPLPRDLVLIRCGFGANPLPAVAPAALADPVWPVGGAESAGATIEDLAAQGYDVQINWVTGYPTVPLSECWVDAIHNPDGPPSQNTLSTVYVDIGCPSNNID